VLREHICIVTRDSEGKGGPHVAEDGGLRGGRELRQVLMTEHHAEAELACLGEHGDKRIRQE